MFREVAMLDIFYLFLSTDPIKLDTMCHFYPRSSNGRHVDTVDVSEFDTEMRARVVDSSQSSQYKNVQFSDKLQSQLFANK